MNLLYIGNNLNSPGSLPTGIQNLGEALRKEGYNIKTASDKKNRFLRLMDMLRLVIRHSKTTDFVLIDTYSTSNFWYAYFVGNLCRQLQLKYIPILHGGNLPKRLKNCRKSCKLLFGNAFLNIAPSHYLLQAFAEAGFSNLKYIPNHIQLDNYEFKSRNCLKPRLLWVRAFAEIYNPILPIKVLEKLIFEYPEAELCMVGPEKDGSFQLCRKYASDNNLPVLFPGKMGRKEWIKLSREYDIFLNSSNIDNTPVSVIEAMALGLPVVSTDVGGMPFLIDSGREGMLIPPNDPESMLSAIQKLLNDPENAQKMAISARQKVEAFQWEKVELEWKEVLT